MRIYLKKINSDGDVSQQDVGFYGLKIALQNKSPLLGLSITIDDAGAVTEAHYLYRLTEDGNSVTWIERYPLRRLANTITAIQDYTHASAMTDPFTRPNKNTGDVTASIPSLSDNAEQCLFLEAEKEVILSPLRDCFSGTSTDVFPDQDPLVIRSILTTLFSAGFISHPSWPDNLALLSNNKVKLEEIASALFALHETGLLTQKTFSAVVNHVTPWKCASGLRYLTDYRTSKHKTQIRLIPFRKAQKIEDDLFYNLPPFIQEIGKKFVNTIVSHSFPEEASRIIALLYHVFGVKLDLHMVDAIACIEDKLTLNYLGATLLRLYRGNLLTKENCLALLKQSNNVIRFKHVLYAMDEKLFSLGLTLTQSMFNSIVFAQDPRLLIAVLSKYVMQSTYGAKPTLPDIFLKLFEHLAKAGMATRQNLQTYGTHKQCEAFAKLLNELIAAGITITQPVFNILCADPDPSNKSAIEILTSTPENRDVLRQNVKNESEKFLFETAEIQAEILDIKVDSKTIRHWLSISTAKEFEEKALERINAIEAAMQPEAYAIQLQKEALRDQSIKIIHTSGLFSLRHAHGVPTTGSDRKASDAVTPVLQQVVFGNENENGKDASAEKNSVKTQLDNTKNNIEVLTDLLCNTSTVTDYSGRQITDTLLKAALRAGDVEMCQMLIPYFDLIPDGKKELDIQLTEVFPDGVEARYQELEEDSKRDFEPMLQAAINAIFNDPDPSNPNNHIDNLHATLNKKVDNPLYQTLETSFRQPYVSLSHRNRTFNPYYYLRVLEMCKELWDQCDHNGHDYFYKKRDLLWCQIKGFCQRFMPACYAQAFSQGLYCLVKVDQPDAWRPEAFRRDLKLRLGWLSYFPLPLDSRSGIGFDFVIYAKRGWHGNRANGRLGTWPGYNVGKLKTSLIAFLKTFVEQKRQGFQNMMPRVRMRLPIDQQSNERCCIIQ